jgi:hypothetical protein
MRHIMSTTTQTGMDTSETTQDGSDRLPTLPCSVVWSRGHAYVLELIVNRPRWVGRDDRGRPVEYSCVELQRRGWTRTAN